MISIIKNYIDKRVDERINEIINNDALELRDISESEAKREISSFILEKKNEGATQLSTLDFVLNLKIPAEQVDRILENYERENKIREIK